MSETMEKPRPSTLFIAGSPDKLAEILKQLGNDRSYNMIRSHGNTWRVHFDGDLVLSTVKIVDGKPVIIKD